MHALIILIAWHGALAEVAIAPVRATDQNEMPPKQKATLHTIAALPTQSGSVYILRTTFIGSSIASF
jgi:hypothetical protein